MLGEGRNHTGSSGEPCIQDVSIDDLLPSRKGLKAIAHIIEETSAVKASRWFSQRKGQLPLHPLFNPSDQLRSLLDLLANLIDGGAHQPKGHGTPDQFDSMILISAAAVDGGHLGATDDDQSSSSACLHRSERGIHQRCRQ